MWGHLNHLYGLNLTHHNINFLYVIRGSLKNRYYLQTRNIMVRLIPCLPYSKRNFAGEFVRVSGNWLNAELTCPTSLRQIGQYLLFRLLRTTLPCIFFALSFFFLFMFVTFLLLLLHIFFIDLFMIPYCSFQKNSTRS